MKAGKNKWLIVFLLVFFSCALAAVKIVFSAPTGECGDGLVQSPNGDGVYEKCDPGTAGETAECTPQCGQKMLGWGWSGTAPGSFGWLSLNCENHAGYPCATAYYTEITADETAKIKGWAWADNVGWICFGETCNNVSFGSGVPFTGWIAQVENDGSETPPVSGWAKIIGLKDNGWISLNCSTSEDASECTKHDYKVLLVKSNFNNQPRLTLKGFGWNNNDNGVGLGWINFSPEIVPPVSWLQTRYGDIYALGGLSGSAPPASMFSATYRILANGAITGFTSQQGLPFIEQGYQYDFPTLATGYTNVLGQLNVNDLVCAFPLGQTTCENNLGQTVELKTNFSGKKWFLAGQVYYLNGPKTIGAANDLDTFQNGSGAANGSGTIVVNGDLTIDTDVAYETFAASANFKNLASVAWIIKGDLKINCNVKNLVGNFIVLGNGTSVCDPDSPVAHCGEIYSTYNSATCQNQLKVSGLMMGRKFYFERKYQSPPPFVEGSELITYDGRLLANTPPGLADFTKALPSWQIGQ